MECGQTPIDGAVAMVQLPSIQRSSIRTPSCIDTCIVTALETVLVLKHSTAWLYLCESHTYTHSAICPRMSS